VTLFGMIAFCIVEILNLSYIGKYRTIFHLSGVGLGKITINILVYSVGYGFLDALDTFIP